MRFLALVIVIGALAWFTHIFYCFSTGAFGFLIAGAILAPIAIFHGIWLWFYGIYLVLANLLAAVGLA